MNVALERAHTRMQWLAAALILAGTHWIQSAAPNLSAETIRMVVASVGSKKALPVCTASKLPQLGAACEPG